MRRFKNYCIGQTALGAQKTYQMTQWETLRDEVCARARVWQFSISIFFGVRKILGVRFGIGRLLCHIYLPHTICMCATRIMAILHLVYRTISCRASRRWSIGMRFECWPISGNTFSIRWMGRRSTNGLNKNSSFCGRSMSRNQKMKPLARLLHFSLLPSNDPAILHGRPLKNHELCSALWAPVFLALD